MHLWDKASKTSRMLAAFRASEGGGKLGRPKTRQSIALGGYTVL
jgi:hypothetical protein